MENTFTICKQWAKKACSLVLLSASLTGGAVAQETVIQRDSTVTVSEDRYGVITNRFFDNWFVSVGAGAQMYIGDHNKQMRFGDRLTPVFEANFGKWFTPGIGVRLGANGYKVKGVTQNGAYATGEGAYPELPWWGYWLSHQEIEYFHAHGDVLFNLTNLIGGYRPSRFYELSTYVGLGWMQALNGPEAKEISANLGVLNTFRLSDAFYLSLDVRGAMVDDRFDGEEGRRYKEGLLTTTAGIGYRFRKRGWDRATSVRITERYEDVAEKQALQRRIAELDRELDLLRKQLAEARSQTVTEVKVEKGVLVAPILVTFPIDTWKVSNEARVNLGFFAQVIKDSGSQEVYTITGYADKGTGSVKRNELLSRNRADVIYRVLVDEFGVDPARLRKDHKGGVENMFYNDPRVSRAVIVKGN